MHQDMSRLGGGLRLCADCDYVPLGTERRQQPGGKAQLENRGSFKCPKLKRLLIAPFLSHEVSEGTGRVTRGFGCRLSDPAELNQGRNSVAV